MTGIVESNSVSIPSELELQIAMVFFGGQFHDIFSPRRNGWKMNFFLDGLLSEAFAVSFGECSKGHFFFPSCDL